MVFYYQNSKIKKYFRNINAYNYPLNDNKKRNFFRFSKQPNSLIAPNTGCNEKGLSEINLVIKDLIIPEEEIMPAFLLKTQIKLSNGNVKKEFGSGDRRIGFV